MNYRLGNLICGLRVCVCGVVSLYCDGCPDAVQDTRDVITKVAVIRIVPASLVNFSVKKGMGGPVYLKK